MDKKDYKDLFFAIRALEDDAIPEDMPRASIQWKGTDVCMDFWCKCGAHLHIDAHFVYSVRCLECQRLYTLGSRVLVMDVTGTEYEDVALEGCVHEASDSRSG